ncbi:MAG: bifunctional UDP-N-acetylglucosamine diphosphorylase/glucosamine-1-phosphate N-acetyltransferase GlmU [Gammaproteobacteria bacterium]
MTLSIVILAAGKGKRMRSELPKVLHVLGGMTLLERVVNTALSLSPKQIYVVYGNGGDRVPTEMAHLPVTWVHQAEQCGTGHAVAQVLPHLEDADRVLVLYGDVPLITTATLHDLLNQTPPEALGLVVTQLEKPAGFGRIVRDTTGNILKIVEQKDADPAQLAIQEINTGILTTTAQHLKTWLPRIKQQNAQNEYYLTDIVAMAVSDDTPVAGISAQCPQEVQGVNNLLELSRLERYYQVQQAHQLMEVGVTVMDPHRLDIRGQVSTDTDVQLDVNVVLEGTIKVGHHTTIAANNVLRNVTLGNHVKIEPNCVIEDAVIGDHCVVGPFARIRPGTRLTAHNKVGNFVEIKNSQLGEGSKVPHLSYIGDATLGKNVNMGAGSITVNYDGVEKHQTLIEDNAFVGCDSQLIAPVVVETGAYIAAGSTITTKAPAHKLTIARNKQRTIDGWKPKTRD